MLVNLTERSCVLFVCDFLNFFLIKTGISKEHGACVSARVYAYICMHICA